MKRIVVIYGESGCGKSSIKKAILKLRPNYNEVVTSTTRPAREGEKNGVDYNFYSDSEMANMVMEDKMLECVAFRDWVYGTERTALKEDAINIGVWNPEGVETLNEDDELECLNVYIKVSPKVRLLRSLSRECNPDVDEIIRRYKTDQKDFEDIDVGFNINIDNEQDRDVEEVAQEIIIRINRRLGRFV